MKSKNVLSIIVCLAVAMAFALPVLANVPAPPVNQIIGVPDTEFSHLVEADCRVCHDSGVPDRHHMLYGKLIPVGECSTWNGTCTGGGDEPCLNDGDCPATETCTAGTRSCVVDSDCVIGQNVCNINGADCPVGTCTGDGTTPCTVDDDCSVAGGTCDAGSCPGRDGQYCGEPLCIGGSALQDSDSNQDGTQDTNYACLSCHLEDTTGGIIRMLVFRDCLICHQQETFYTPTVHHATDDAQSGICSSCHGTLVDDVAGCKLLTCAPTSGANRGKPTTLCDYDNPSDPNEDCAAGERCAYYAIGTCSATTTTPCNYDSECPPSETCVQTAACDDGHVIPTYEPSLVTPERSSHGHVCEGTADACNVDDDCTAGTCSVTTTTVCHQDADCPGGETCVGGVQCVEDDLSLLPGNCAYCHQPGLNTVGTALDVLDNHDTHHHTGVYKYPEGGSDSAKCAWCHMAGYAHTPYGEVPEHIRWCENCHGYESLHNIQVESPDPDSEVKVGGEMPGYGHIGNDSDCWGCHGFVIAAAPGSGPLTPYLNEASTVGVTSGYDTMVTLVGATLTNLVGSYQWTSDVSMTAADGSAVTLAPSSISNSEMAVTIPASTAPGNYALRAVKGTSAASNPIVISVKPEVAIADTSCNKKKGVLTVSGSGFGEKPAGSDAYINVQVNGQAMDVTSWSDTQITASVSSCSNNAAITVNAVMGSATSGNGGGKPDRPCKGKKCN